MYLCDFITMSDGARYFMSADVRSGELRMERIEHSAIEQFIRNVIAIGSDGSLPNGRLRRASEVSA